MSEDKIEVEDGPAVLRRFHHQPGRTVEAFAQWRNGEGISSYELLAREAEGLGPETHILDLACGDGYLLELLRRRGFRNLSGVDSSARELAAARRRLGPACELRHEPAQSLSLSSDSVGLVVCHLALMLFEPLEPVLAELARVLEPGGRFLAVINRPFQDPALACLTRQRRGLEAEIGLAPLRLGDPRIFRVDGFRELAGTLPFGEVLCRDFHIETRGTPAQIWSALRHTYDLFRLPAPARDELKRRVLKSWRVLAGKCGTLRCVMGLRFLSALFKP